VQDEGHGAQMREADGMVMGSGYVFYDLFSGQSKMIWAWHGMGTLSLGLLDCLK